MINLSFSRTIVLLFLVMCLSNFAFAQSRNNQLIQVLVSPNKADWTYEKNDEISFNVSVLKHQIAIQDVEISYKIGWEKMDPLQTGVTKLTATDQLIGKPLKVNQSGFIRCEVTVNYEGQQYRGIATAGISPELIEPTQSYPDDFNSFWTKEIASLKTIPLDPKITLLPERSTATVDVFSVDFQNINKSRIYGILAKPKKAGKYPAVLQVPGAGIRPYQGLIQQAEKGIVTLQIGIHGIPITNEIELYQSLSTGALSNYAYFNLDDRDQYYYKRVYLGCIRAVDFLYNHEEVNVDNIQVWGGSQGGALSIVTAALDKRIKSLVALYPAISDLTGYLHNRAGGWPHMFNKQNAAFMATPEKIKNSAYYDVVNFARQITIPGFYTWGYNDETCPPTSYYSAYNLINAPKTLYLVQETGHWTFAEQQNKIFDWVLENAGIKQ